MARSSSVSCAKRCTPRRPERPRHDGVLGPARTQFMKGNPRMSFEPSRKIQELQQRLNAFMEAYIYPNEKRHVKEAESLGPWKVFPLIEELKPKAREAGLWNLFLPDSPHGAGLTNLEYAPLCEIMGRWPLGPEGFN